MNYAQYLKNGNQLAEPAVETRLGEKEVNQLVQRIIQGDKEAATILVENAIKDPENAWITDAIQGAQSAAEQGNELAIKFWEIVSPLLQLATQAQSMKCGGKVRAKIKKACGGKKLEEGDKIKKAKKGCPCSLKKVGGRLIEVDCNGIPVAKKGTKIVYSQTPAMSTAGWLLVPQELANVLDPHKYEDPLLNHQYEYQRYNKQKQAEEKRKQEMADSEAWRNSFNAGGINYNGKLPNFYATNAMKKEEPLPNIWTQNAENYSKQAEEYATQKLHKQHPELVQKKEQPQTTWRDTFGAGKAGKFGGLTYDEAIARQKEMAAAQGFNANFGRQDGMWGQKSKAEWERYQAWKQQQVDLAQRKADREAAGPLLSRPAVQAQAVQQSVLPQTLGYDKMGTDERFVKQGYASGRPWTDAEIKNMDPAQALYLNDEDYRRYLGKTFTNTLQPPMYAYNAGGYNIPDYSAFFRKQGGSLNYAQYLNLK